MLGIRTSLILVVSGGGSAATGLGRRPRSPAVPASVSPPRNLRRLNRRACWILMGTSLPPLPLQLLLQLIEEAPVGALGDELLRAALDHASLVQAQSIEAHVSPQ